MSDFQIFDSPEFGDVRAMMIDDEPWFVGRDVAEALGYGGENKRSKAIVNAINDHVDDEDKMHLDYEYFKQYQNGDLKDISHYGVTIINESGLYSLIMSSKLPSAKKFKRWVTSEVLPSLRRTGVYAVPTDAIPERPITRDDYINAAKIFSTCRNERLPMVYNMLTKAGLDMSKIQLPARKPRSNRGGSRLKSSVANNDLARAIDDAIVNKGISASQIAEVAGCHRTEICNYRTGVRTANEAKAAAILNAIKFLEETGGGDEAWAF